jgi:hypothetical protein
VIADREAAESRRFAWLEGQAMSSWVLADVHNAVHRPELAAVYLREAYEDLRRAANLGWGADALGELAATELAQGRIDQALLLHRQALDLGRGRLTPYWYADLLVSLVPGLLKAGRLADAARLVDESRGLGEDRPSTRACLSCT